MSTIPVNGSSPARKRSTAISFAAFKTAGIDPPARHAAYASSTAGKRCGSTAVNSSVRILARSRRANGAATRSEEHTSELQSRENLVCRLLLEKKNKYIVYT